MLTHRAAPYMPTRGLHTVALWSAVPLAVAQAQTSPFMTGATALQTNILAWLTPIAMHLKMEQRGLRSHVAEGLRAEYRERVARRLEPQAARDGPEVAPREESGAASAVLTGTATTDVEEIRRRAREAWLRLRSRERQTGADSSDRSQGSDREAHEHDSAAARSPQDDLAL